MEMMVLLVTVGVALTGSRAVAPAFRWWGVRGHEMAARAALATLPVGMPSFFRNAADQLVYLDPEPDRWRVRELGAMDGAFALDHFIWMENVPPGALDASDRFAFIQALYGAGIADGPKNVGLLPYRVLELYQRLVAEWRLWRQEPDARRREWIEQRIVNDAGILGHYVTDASNPHHTSANHAGWSANIPNPGGYTTDPGFHSRFERDFVESFVRQVDVTSRVRGEPRSVAGKAWQAILDEIRESHAQVEPLFRLDRDVGFDPHGPLHAATRDFAAERLAAGADALRVLWWSAWLESAKSQAPLRIPGRSPGLLPSAGDPKPASPRREPTGRGSSP